MFLGEFTEIVGLFILGGTKPLEDGEEPLVMAVWFGDRKSAVNEYVGVPL